MSLRRWETRLKRLEAQAGPIKDLSTQATTEAMKRLPNGDLCLLFDAIEREELEGDIIDAADLLPLLDEDEAAALRKLCELSDEVREEWS